MPTPTFLLSGEKMKRFLNGVALAIAVLAIALTLPSFLPPMQAQSPPILLSQNVNFTPPDVIDPYYRRQGTPKGSACPRDLLVIPLMPQSNIGLTVAESPTVFVYVSLNSIPIEFIVQADEGIGIEAYKTTFKVDQPGIVEVSISEKGDRQKSLEVKKRYQWSFSVACNDDRSTDYYVVGFVKRIEPQETLKKDLANPDPMARAIAYAKNGIWYDTVSTLAQMRRRSPDDASLKAEWTHLLKSQKLEAVADKPLVQSF